MKQLINFACILIRGWESLFQNSVFHLCGYRLGPMLEYVFETHFYKSHFIIYLIGPLIFRQTILLLYSVLDLLIIKRFFRASLRKLGLSKKRGKYKEHL